MNGLALVRKQNTQLGYTVNKFGASTITTTQESLTRGIDTLYPFPSTAETIRIKAGGNAADVNESTGAHRVIVYGLDANYNEINDTLTCQGESASSYSTKEFLRITRAYVLEVGSAGSNVGSISIENESGTVLAFIEAGYGQTEMLLYTVPSGYQLIITAIHLYIASAKPVTFQIFRRVPGQAWRLLWDVREAVNPISNVFNSAYLLLDETEDLDVRCQTTTGTSECSGTIEMILIKKDKII